MDLIWSLMKACLILFWFFAAGSFGLLMIYFKPARRMLERLLKADIDIF